MAAGTVLSRVSGFARLLAVGWALGLGRLSDAYNLANTIPNSMYDLLLGGVLSATLLPVLMQSLTTAGAGPGWAGGAGTLDGAVGENDDTVPAVVSFLTVALVVATVLFWLAAPLLVRLFLIEASGPRSLAERQLATTWLRLFTPQLLFIGLITVTTALLNARRRFGAVAFSPVIANVVTIVALFAADRMVHAASAGAFERDGAAVAVVGIGTTAGYLAQLLAQLPALWRARVPLRPRWHPGHPALRRIGRLSGWTIGAVVTNQLSLLLVTLLATEKGGNYSAFSYAYAFMLLPYAVIAVSITAAVAPELAESWSSGDREGFARRTSDAMRGMLVLLLPAGAGYALVARPVVVLAMAHGHLSLSNARLTGSVLVIFALGLPGFSCYLLLMRAFQSKQDTRSMFWLYLLENALTVAAALAMYPSLGVLGLTAAWIGGYTVTLPVAWWRLHRSAPLRVPIGWWLRAAAATALMAVAVAIAVRLFPAPSSDVGAGLRLLLLVTLGTGIFVLAARALRVRELTALTSRLRSLAR